MIIYFCKKVRDTVLEKHKFILSFQFQFQPFSATLDLGLRITLKLNSLTFSTCSWKVFKKCFFAQPIVIAVKHCLRLDIQVSL